MKDLPEVFGSSDISKFKQTTTTTTNVKKGGDIDMKNLTQNLILLILTISNRLQQLGVPCNSLIIL